MTKPGTPPHGLARAKGQKEWRKNSKKKSKERACSGTKRRVSGKTVRRVSAKAARASARVEALKSSSPRQGVAPAFVRFWTKADKAEFLTGMVCPLMKSGHRGHGTTVFRATQHFREMF